MDSNSLFYFFPTIIPITEKALPDHHEAAGPLSLGVKMVLFSCCYFFASMDIDSVLQGFVG